jgi:hypothetical protein
VTGINISWSVYEVTVEDRKTIDVCFGIALEDGEVHLVSIVSVQAALERLVRHPDIQTQYVALLYESRIGPSLGATNSTRDQDSRECGRYARCYPPRDREVIDNQPLSRAGESE